jgi:hypothetical protein
MQVMITVHGFTVTEKERQNILRELTGLRVNSAQNPALTALYKMLDDAELGS